MHEPPPDDEPTLGEAFTAVARQLRHVTHEALLPFGITPGQGRALAVLRRHGPMRLADLSAHLRIAPRSATEVVDALQERGLAGRSPDPDDRRATRVALTTEGERVSAAVGAARAGGTEAFFDRLGTADRADLARILRALNS